MNALLEDQLVAALDEATAHVGRAAPAWPPGGRLVAVGHDDARHRHRRRPLLVSALAAAAAVATVVVLSTQATQPVGQPAGSPAPAPGEVQLGEPPMLWPNERSAADRSSAEVVADAFAQEVLAFPGGALGSMQPIPPGPGALDASRVTLSSAAASVVVDLERRPTGWYVAQVGADRSMPALALIGGGPLSFVAPAGTVAAVVVATVNDMQVERQLSGEELATAVIPFTGVVSVYLLIYLDQTGQVIGAQGTTIDPLRVGTVTTTTG